MELLKHQQELTSGSSAEQQQAAQQARLASVFGTPPKAAASFTLPPTGHPSGRAAIPTTYKTKVKLRTGAPSARHASATVLTASATACTPTASTATAGTPREPNQAYPGRITLMASAPSSASHPCSATH
eukprot:837848-Pelagomonas_calceolata.AAC.1